MRLNLVHQESVFFGASDGGQRSSLAPAALGHVCPVSQGAAEAIENAVNGCNVVAVPVAREEHSVVQAKVIRPDRLTGGVAGWPAGGSVRGLAGREARGLSGG